MDGLFIMLLLLLLILILIGILAYKNNTDKNKISIEIRKVKFNKISTLSVLDPHHRDNPLRVEWIYHKDKFYHRHAHNSKEWIATKKISVTPKRVKMLMKLLEINGVNINNL